MEKLIYNYINIDFFLKLYNYKGYSRVIHNQEWGHYLDYDIISICTFVIENLSSK